jgi:RND family efflux transporter MFP subunit
LTKIDKRMVQTICTVCGGNLANFPKRIRVAVLVAAALLATASGCGKSDSGNEATLVPEVTVTTVRKGSIVQNLTVSGNLTALPNRDAKIAALVPGRIQRVLVTEGDSVHPGQLVAQVDPVSLRDQLVQADAAVSQARANVENARIAAERNEGLLQRGIAARKEVEDAKTQLSVTQAQLKQAEAARSAARTQVNRSELRAPFAGTVVHRFLGVGEQVDGSSGQPVVEIADIRTLELLGTVPASRLSEVQKGARFSFQTSAVSGESFAAQVIDVLPAVDPATDNGTVRVRIDNAKHLLKLGMFLTIDLVLKQTSTSLVVPKQAVYPDEAGEPHVYKVTGDEAEFIPVQLGIQTKDQAQIVSGVEDGNVIILSGGYGLPEKTKVRTKP